MFPSKGCNPSGISHGIFFNLQHHCTVADPDLGIRGAGQSSIPLDGRGGGGVVSQKIFSSLRASVWSRNKGGAVLLGPSLGSATPVAASAHYISSGAFSEQTNLCNVNEHAVIMNSLPQSSPFLPDALLIIRIRFLQLESTL